jgi:hypothetical protein
MTKKVLSSVLLVLIAGALTAGVAYGSPRLWTDSSEKTLLRSVKATPKNQPDALEFVNEGNVSFKFFIEGAVKTVTCSEIEAGTTVVANNELVKVVETKLAMPFGVAEGDDCTIPNTAGELESAPVYFDTNAAGAVPATITLTGPPFEATLHKLKLSLNVQGKFCTANLEGVTGVVANATEGFVEESPANLNLTVNSTVPVSCPPNKGNLEVKARFFAETMSTTTDTAFIGP